MQSFQETCTRIGRISVTQDFIDKGNLAPLWQQFNRFGILWEGNGIREYIGYAEDFDLVSPDQFIPRYEAKMEEEEGQIRVWFEREPEKT